MLPNENSSLKDDLFDALVTTPFRVLRGQIRSSRNGYRGQAAARREE